MYIKAQSVYLYLLKYSPSRIKLIQTHVGCQTAFLQ